MVWIFLKPGQRAMSNKDEPAKGGLMIGVHHGNPNHRQKLLNVQTLHQIERYQILGHTKEIQTYKNIAQ
jgi:hypothetical protein